MRIYNSELWLSDLDETILALPELDGLAGEKIFVTGCTGLVCSAVVDCLIRWNINHNKKIKILAAGRNTKNVLDRFAPYSGESWFSTVYYDAIAADNSYAMPCDYIIHGASNASPDMIVKEPVETMLSNFVGMKNLLDYAKCVSARRILFISSSEVYGKKQGDEPFHTDEYGYIDLLNPRNSYSVGKRAAETLCVSYAEEYGVESVIARPGHIYGPTATEHDNRVSSAWAYAAAHGESIVMKSDGCQLRSYCYCLDCASAILKILLAGESGKAYNISNPNSVITIKKMAELLANNAKVELKMEIPTEAEKRGFNPMSNSSLDSSDLLALGWEGLFDAERGFSHTINILREIQIR
ncbi:MAG: NAD-dependent epimerase/dehydratase family protein [Ruminococcaceae bacterium]|nr:NAD-dependent epimerase/dehydratase family protein [Oscillospiraceae bacterium]